MKSKHLGLVIDPELHYKLHYISKYEGRSANSQILFLLRRYISEFESVNGVIDLAPLYDDTNSSDN